MIGDGAIRYREFLPEVWKQSSIDGTPIESYQSQASGLQAAQPRETSLQPQPAPRAPRTIEAMTSGKN